jgi:hypothetical protein
MAILARAKGLTPKPDLSSHSDRMTDESNFEPGRAPDERNWRFGPGQGA